MTSRKHANNVTTTLASGISDVATSLTVTSATGFPSISAGETVRVTITDGTLYEILELTESASSPTYNSVNRGMEGTVAQTWSAGVLVVIMGTADSWDRKQDKIASSSDEINFGDAGSFEIPNSSAPTVNTAGEIALDTSITDHKPLVKYHTGSEEMVVVAMPTANLSNSDGHVISYDAATDSFEMTAPGASGTDFDSYTTTITSGGTTTLTVSSNYQQFFTGSTVGDIVKMPVTSTLFVGFHRLIVNDSSVMIDVQSSGSNSIVQLAGGTAVIVTCISTSGTTAASWSYQYAAKQGGVYYPFRNNTGNVTLLGNSVYMQYYNDSGTVNNTMPVAARLVNGQSWMWVNQKSSGDLNIYASDSATLLLVIPIGYKAEFTCKDNAGGTGAGPWVWDLQPLGLKGNKPIVQTVFTTTGTMATGSTTIPLDNTTPQNTEGDEYMTLAITPTNSSNILDIEVGAFFSNSASEGSSFALFQDSTANCLKSGIIGAIVIAPVVLRHRMTAGTTSSTTFKFRIGRSSAGTITFNGFGSASYMNGTLSSYIKITEYKV